MDRDRQIERLAEDLEQVKSAINRSAIVMREVMGPAHYRLLVLYAGIATLALCLAFHFAPLPWGGFAASPAWLRWLLVAAAVIGLVGGGLVKTLSVSRAARAVDRRLGFFSFFRRYYGFMVVHLYLPLGLILLGVCGWLLATGRASFVAGAMGLFSGILMNLLAVTFRQNEYLVFGYWLLATSAASFFVPGLAPALWFAVIFGLGCLVFWAAAVLVSRRR
jgi:hypothetical protein